MRKQKRCYIYTRVPTAIQVDGYGLTLPQEFIDHVMSKAGTEFIQKCKESGESWFGIIDEMKNRENTLCLLPDDAGDIELENF